MSRAFPRQLDYAIGDIHGRYDLLEMALARIASHSAGAPSRTIFLGDYIDRGPESRRVIERLMALETEGEVVCLKGNHEDMMIRAWTEPMSASFRRWLQYGGRETLASYGDAPADNPMAAVPAEHIRWMTGLPLTTADAHRIYVHAGLSPHTVFHLQSEATCLWIREPFLRAPAEEFDTHIVHGHTPVWQGKPDPSRPELLPHRTNLDTAAFASGILTIGVFDPDRAGGPVEVLTVQGEERTYIDDVDRHEPARRAEEAPRPRRRWSFSRAPTT